MVLTDVHTHSAFSPDGETPLDNMLARAHALGAAYYGIAEHFDYDYAAEDIRIDGQPLRLIDADAYFAEARRLQRAYEGRMRVLAGGEFGYSPSPQAAERYEKTIARFSPDFIVNSVHTVDGCDAWFPLYFAHKQKYDAYAAYLDRVRRSLEAPYPYDIVGHLGYVARNAPYEDPALRYEEFADRIDDILTVVIRKHKILEVNASARRAGDFLPGPDILARYFALGGRAVSFASDAHAAKNICLRRAHVVAALKDIGFTHLTVPDRGEYRPIPLYDRGTL